MVDRASQPTLRIGLRLWGFDVPEVENWLRDLPSQNGRISWEIAHDKDNTGEGLIVHLVRSSPAWLSTFCWNCAGANRAIQRSARTPTVHVALFSGDPARLPAQRTKSWVVVEAGSEREALRSLARSYVNWRARSPST